MIGITPDQQQALQEISESMNTTFYGRAWPDEYNHFSRLWGYFNSIYDTVYPRRRGQPEWDQIALFAIDNQFSHVWTVLEPTGIVQKLVNEACVGNGKNNFVPTNKVRIAYYVLRNYFKMDISKVCQNTKCQDRKIKGWQLCETWAWPPAPANLNTIQNAHYTPIGATLTIIYQIRNNLFHGSKNEVTGRDFHRNLFLIQASSEILENVLQQINKLI